MNAPSWYRGMLSESDGTPSSSRTVMFLWAIFLLPAFLAWGSWEAYNTGKLPDVTGWATFLGFAQAGGALGYLGNQLRRGLSGSPTSPGSA